jgi:CheY-like chemotaxis protein
VLAPGEPAYAVLVVDDVEETRTMLVRLLTAAGFEAREAANGREAVEVWEQWRPAIILMDVRMPEVNGLEATRRIRRAEMGQGQRVPIIAVSASALDHEIEDILAAGCDDFLAKPFREATLFEKIGALVGARFEGQEAVAGGDAPAPAGGGRGLGSLPAVAPELVDRLKQAVIAGDVKEGRSVAGEIRRIDEALGRHLEEMIGHYQFDELERLIDGASPEAGPSSARSPE